MSPAASSAPPSSLLSELLTKLLMDRRTPDEKRLVAFLKQGEGFSWPQVDQLLQVRMRVWRKQLQIYEEGETTEASTADTDMDGEKKVGRKRGRSESVTPPLTSSSSSSSSSKLPVDEYGVRRYDGFDFSVWHGVNHVTSGFFGLSPYDRLVLLKNLCEYHLSVSPDFAATVRDVLPPDA